MGKQPDRRRRRDEVQVTLILAAPPRQVRKEPRMRGKLWFLGGVAAGFVLGARAGREKYNELVMNARKVWDHPTVQEAAGVVQAQANRLYTEGKGTVTDKLSHTKIGERMSSKPEQPELAKSTSGSSKSSPSSESSASGSSRPSTNSTTF
jgi:hypothetical protein